MASDESITAEDRTSALSSLNILNSRYFTIKADVRSARVVESKNPGGPTGATACLSLNGATLKNRMRKLASIDLNRNSRDRCSSSGRISSVMSR
jgi:hypothetical protein